MCRPANFALWYGVSLCEMAHCAYYTMATLSNNPSTSRVIVYHIMATLSNNHVGIVVIVYRTMATMSNTHVGIVVILAR